MEAGSAPAIVGRKKREEIYTKKLWNLEINLETFVEKLWKFRFQK